MVPSLLSFTVLALTTAAATPILNSSVSEVQQDNQETTTTVFNVTQLKVDKQEVTPTPPIQRFTTSVPWLQQYSHKFASMFSIIPELQNENQELRSSLFVNQLAILETLSQTRRTGGASSHSPEDLAKKLAMMWSRMNETAEAVANIPSDLNTTRHQVLTELQQVDDHLALILHQERVANENRMETLESGMQGLAQQLTEVKQQITSLVNHTRMETLESGMQGLAQQLTEVKQQITSPDKSTHPSVYKASCPKDFFLLRKECLYINNGEQLSWQSARNWCRARGGDLADSLYPLELIAKINSVVGSSSVWLGGSDSATEGSWIGVSGRPIPSTLWRRGEPNNARRGEDCLELSGNPSLFNDAPCTKEQSFVCEHHS